MALSVAAAMLTSQRHYFVGGHSAVCRAAERLQCGSPAFAHSTGRFRLSDAGVISGYFKFDLGVRQQA
jgi:hypothetical protein